MQSEEQLFVRVKRVGSFDVDILVVGEDSDFNEMLHTGLSSRGLECIITEDSHEAAELIKNTTFRVIVSEVAMNNITGLGLLTLASSLNPDTRVILMTGISATRYLAEALRLGAYDYFQKPVAPEAMIESIVHAISDEAFHGGLTMRAARAMLHEDRQNQTSLEMISALVRAVEAKDPYTRRHSEQVTFYATQLGEQAGLPAEQIELIRVASLLHDVGKIGVPDRILTKAGKLTDQEFMQIRKHSITGANIVKRVSLLACETDLIRHHHEKWDGTGYPDGLAGEEIPIGARVINVADSIDAMLMARTYKNPYTIEKMLSELTRCSATQFDPELAEIALHWCKQNTGCLFNISEAA